MGMELSVAEAFTALQYKWSQDCAGAWRRPVVPAAGEDAPALLSLSVLLGFLRAGACVCARVHVSACIHVHTVEPGGREVDKWYPGALLLTCL